jgi:hypothetical protein
MPQPKSPLTLFIIKKFYDYDGHRQVSNGLKTSALFVVNLLLSEGHRAKLVEAIDANCIHRLIRENGPAARVVLEAIWVTPTKMRELQQLNPTVKWTVRVHSETTFLQNEGVATEWIAAYLNQGIEVAFNSSVTVDDFSLLAPTTYLPNYYPLRKPRPSQSNGDVLNVGCFGAIRPLKNQLIQAIAACRFAKEAGTKMVFHMNGSRIEQSGSSSLRNVEALLMAAGQTLELHPWMDHEDFLELVASMDICLQVSLTESFCIVASDAISMGVPLVGSPAIRWLPERSQADVSSSDSIVAAIKRADATTVIMNQDALKRYLRRAVDAWNSWVTNV